MRLAEFLYSKVTGKEAPYYLKKNSVLKLLLKPIRKYFTNVVAANCPFNCIRILIYRLCGFKIGKGTFIGMRCYLDDLSYKYMSIGNNCTISYGVFFACHGRKQANRPITICDGVYIGMRSNIISKGESIDGITIGCNAVIGAATLVNKSIPEGATAVGVPCRIIKEKLGNE